MEATHVLKVSLPETVYEAACRIAVELGVSLEQLARETIAARTERYAKHDLTSAYDTLAEDADMTDVEGFLEAQAEVLSND